MFARVWTSINIKKRKPNYHTNWCIKMRDIYCLQRVQLFIYKRQRWRRYKWCALAQNVCWSKSLVMVCLIDSTQFSSVKWKSRFSFVKILVETITTNSKWELFYQMRFLQKACACVQADDIIFKLRFYIGLFIKTVYHYGVIGLKLG